MDTFADRIYATYRWKEENIPDPDVSGYKYIDLEVQVEIVTGEVVDIIYQVFPVEKYGDGLWVKDYRKKADAYAKMVIDTILRNSVLADKMVEHVVKVKQFTAEQALKKLEEITPFAQIVPNAKPKPKPASPHQDNK